MASSLVTAQAEGTHNWINESTRMHEGLREARSGRSNAGGGQIGTMVVCLPPAHMETIRGVATTEAAIPGVEVRSHPTLLVGTA
uniref:Uncharacterized protein n=1 Tax=Triticum urartu TaxID=4572 RepID=A0A8R7PZH1_TRIUA